MMWLLVGLVALPCCLAQMPVQDAEASGMTLHVTVRELQVAALILDGHRKPITNIESSRFRLRVDSGKPFLPRTVHREGDDPISLAVVMDVSQPRRYHVGLAEALSGMRETSLLAQDHLLLFAVDCNLISYQGETLTPQGARLGVEQVLGNANLHRPGSREITCADSVHLWDAALLAMRRLAKMPGRHVLLLMTDGHDSGSATSMGSLAGYSSLTATTIFALPSTDMQVPNGSRSPLELLMMRTGGALLDAPSKDHVERSLADCIEMLRGRYILGFTRPPGLAVGVHAIEAMVQRGVYLVRTSGVSMPLPAKDDSVTTPGQDTTSDRPVKP